MSIRKHGLVVPSFPFLPVTLTTGVSLSDRFEEFRKIEKPLPHHQQNQNNHQVEVSEDYEHHNQQQRQDYSYSHSSDSRREHDYMARQHRMGQWKKPFRLMNQNYQNQQYQSQNRQFHPTTARPVFPIPVMKRPTVPVQYRLSIPRERYGWKNNRVAYSSIPQPQPRNFQSYRPRNRRYGQQFFKQRNPEYNNNHIGVANRFHGYVPRNPGRQANNNNYRGGGNRRKFWISKDKLDKELDQYMSKTKAYLDRQLDQYIEEAKAAAAANFAVGCTPQEAPSMETEAMLLDELD